MNNFKEFSKDYTLACTCEKCKLDIMAITLNKLKPKYVSSDEGEVLIKVLYSDIQLQYDVIKEITLATMVVENNPKH